MERSEAIDESTRGLTDRTVVPPGHISRRSLGAGAMRSLSGRKDASMDINAGFDRYRCFPLHAWGLDDDGARLKAKRSPSRDGGARPQSERCLPPHLPESDPVARVDTSAEPGRGSAPPAPVVRRWARLVRRLTKTDEAGRARVPPTDSPGQSDRAWSEAPRVPGNPEVTGMPLLRVVRPGGGRLFRLFGELDVSSVGELTGAVLPHLHGQSDVILDLADLTFTDGSGIQGFIEIARELGTDGNVILLSPRPCVARVLEITRIAETFPNLIVLATHDPSTRTTRRPSKPAVISLESDPGLVLESKRGSRLTERLSP
jgi:anti-anti-sigma factor